MCSERMDSECKNIVVVCAPSGTGKSTIIQELMKRPLGRMLHFSVSATNRAPRPGEEHGVHYHFLTGDEFRQHIQAGDFAEYEEVYPGRFYGTLRSEIERKASQGICLLDVDVKGALSVKRLFGPRALTIFIMPPSVEALRRRLEGRATDSPEEIDRRISRAEFEMSFASQMDTIVVNDNLARAVSEVEKRIVDFVGI